MNYKIGQVIKCGNGYCVKIEGFGENAKNEKTVKYSIYANESEMSKTANQAVLRNREETVNRLDTEIKAYKKKGTRNINMWLLQQCASALADIEADKKSGGKNKAVINRNIGNIGLGFSGRKFVMNGYKPVKKTKTKKVFVNLTSSAVMAQIEASRIAIQG